MRLVWLPGQFKAAIAITDDPDNGTFASFKTIYDLLLRLKLPVSRAMWAFDPVEPTGTPPLEIRFFAPVLSDPQCLHYCKRLHENGFEICLHGASSGNNTRERTLAAFELLEREIGKSRLYICHSKNAENLYWNHKCVPSRLIAPIVRQYTKNFSFGEEEGSRYFWGDISRGAISYIRLFRTRSADTLAFNPSMPYHNFNMPYVNYWFSATKGYLPRLLEQSTLDALCSEHGAGIFYQYLHKYVTDSGEINPAVQAGLERLSGDSRILVQPVSALLDRLKQFQLLFPVFHKGNTYIINASEKSVESLQIELDAGESIQPAAPGTVEITGRTVRIASIGPRSVFHLGHTGSPTLAPRAKANVRGRIAEIIFPLATILANISPESAEIPPRLLRRCPRRLSLDRIGPNEVIVSYENDDARRLEIVKPISNGELRKLYFGQAKILLREHVVLGRKIQVSEYLKETGKVEDQANW